MTTALEEDELLTEVRLPILPADTRFGFYEFNRRAGDFALAMALVTYRVAERRDQRAARRRSAASSRSRAALRRPSRRSPGRPPGREAFEAAAEPLAAAVDPLEDAITSADYRRDLARTVTRRALGTGGGMSEKREITLAINGRSYGVRVDAAPHAGRHNPRRMRPDRNAYRL